MGVTDTPSYSPKQVQELEKRIRFARKLFDSDESASVDLNDGATVLADEVEEESVSRISTGFPEIDWMFGETVTDCGKEMGIPEGATSLWAGSAGVGKTRLLTALSKNINRMGGRVLIFQSEMSLAQYRGVIGDIPNSSEFFISTKQKVERQMSEIMARRPTFVIVDSVNAIEGNSRASAIKHFFEESRKTVDVTGVHVAVIGHLNRQGKVKGSTDMEHLPDVVVNVSHHGPEGVMKGGYFMCEIPNKNRYGLTGRFSVFKHTRKGVVCISQESEKEENQPRED
jgi:predicted ATP-dependent serine protease